MPWLVAAGVGAVLSVVGALVVARITGRAVTGRQLLAAAIGGAVSGLVLVGTLGAGATLGTAVGASVGREIAAFTASGAAGGAAEQASKNVLEGRPVGQGVGTATVVGAGEGAVLGGAARVVKAVVRPLLSHAAPEIAPVEAPAAAAPAARPAEIGAAQVIEGERPGARTGSPSATPRGPPSEGPVATATATSVHTAPPAWLEQRFASTVEAVREGRAGPQATPEDVASFLHETYEHVQEVNALVAEMGGRPRPIPAVEPATDEALRGVHDFGERASVRRVQELVDQLRRDPLETRDGVPLEVPGWLASLPNEARIAGETTVDVGKLSPNVAAGLAKKGPPDPFAIKLHNLSAHHSQTPHGNALIEAIADRVNAMRQPRIYRPVPMSFDKIREIVTGEIDRGSLPQEAREVLEKAIAAEAKLEQSGQINPYHQIAGN